jgi:hypothetical protein
MTKKSKGSTEQKGAVKAKRAAIKKRSLKKHGDLTKAPRDDGCIASAGASSVLFSTSRRRPRVGSGYPDRVREHPAGTVAAETKPVTRAASAQTLFFDVARQRPVAVIEEPSIEEMFRASLHAFWRLAEIFRLTIAERAKLLGVSERTCQRWKQATPEPDINALDRLQLILRTYQHLCELAPVTEAEQARVFRSEGSAEDPEHPERSLFDALAVPSILEMHANAQRFAALAHAV